ncbi:MAG: 3-deoxy-D-manno-octulosonic acid transferase [Bacteroidota bacterium]
MKLLYYIVIQTFGLLLRLASMFNHKARLFVNGRKKIFKNLREFSDGEKVAWFHCASLGEFEQGRVLIEKIKKQSPDYRILLTFFSPSGYEIRKNYQFADYITYLPLDTPGNARKFIKLVKPDKAFFIKYEFWYFFLRELKKSHVDTYLVSGIFRKEQFFFRWYGKAFRKMIDWFDYIFVQDHSSYNLLQSYGYTNVAISGDTRLDRAVDLVNNAEEMPLVSIFKQEQLLFIAGSTWPKDEEILIRFYREHSKPFKMIIAPHEVHLSNIERLMNNLKEYVVIKYSEANENNIAGADVLIIDSIGLLSALYRYGEFAYIGGGFGKGIHNLLEAATWGIPVVFGPNYHKFKEAHELINLGGGFSINSYESLKSTFNEFLHDSNFLNNAGNVAKQYIEENSGATDMIFKKTFTQHS